MKSWKQWFRLYEPLEVKPGDDPMYRRGMDKGYRQGVSWACDILLEVLESERSRMTLSRKEDRGFQKAIDLIDELAEVNSEITNGPNVHWTATKSESLGDGSTLTATWSSSKPGMIK